MNKFSVQSIDFLSKACYNGRSPKKTVEYPDESSWDKDQEVYTNWFSYKQWDALIEDRKQVDTSACAMITRPYTTEDSDDSQTPENPSNPDSPYPSDEVYSKSEIDGKNGTDTLYVGEDASAYWVTDAPYYPTHRITEYQHILYGVSVGVPYSPDIIKKLVDSKDDPYATVYNSRATQSCNKKYSEENIDTKIGPS